MFKARPSALSGSISVKPNWAVCLGYVEEQQNIVYRRGDLTYCDKGSGANFLQLAKEAEPWSLDCAARLNCVLFEPVHYV